MANSSVSSTSSSTFAWSEEDHAPYSSPPSTRASSPNLCYNPLKNLKLPIQLPRPDALCQPPSLPTQSNVPLSYTMEKMRSLGPCLLNSSSRSKIILPDDTRCSLPNRLRIDSSSLEKGDIRPSHVLAIHGQKDAKTILLPIHDLVYSQNCLALSDLLDDDDRSRGLPVVHILLPNTSTFPLIHAQLTSPSPSLLLSRLLPKVDHSSLMNPSPSSHSQLLSKQCDNETLLIAIGQQNDFWKNLIALGCCNDEIWNVLRLAYGIILSALVIRGGLERDSFGS